MKLQASHALGVPTFVISVRWPDGERAQLEVCADTAEAAEEYARDIWGQSIRVTVTPKDASRG